MKKPRLKRKRRTTCVILGIRLVNCATCGVLLEREDTYLCEACASDLYRKES